MRYAVPITDDKMSAHFGHCQGFALIHADEAKGIILNKEVVPSPDMNRDYCPHGWQSTGFPLS